MHFVVADTHWFVKIISAGIFIVIVVVVICTKKSYIFRCYRYRYPFSFFFLVEVYNLIHLIYVCS